MQQFLQTKLASMLITFVISMTPVLELRGAIPVGVARGLPLWEAVAISIIGNIVPVPFIVLFIRNIFAWMRRRLPALNGVVERMEAKAARQSDLVTRYQMLGLCILVAIPLPGTGAWTGALIAGLLGMRISRAFPAIALGVLIAGVIVTAATVGVGSLLA